MTERVVTIPGGDRIWYNTGVKWCNQHQFHPLTSRLRKQEMAMPKSTPSHDPNPSGLCMCGCGQTTAIAPRTKNAIGAVKGKHYRFVFRHHLPKVKTLEARFLALADVRSDHECWNWTGMKNKDGYGQMMVKRVTKRAHRVAWELFRGEIDSDTCVCHSCDNRLCVNPAHLFIGTNVDNTRDRHVKGRSMRGEGIGTSVLTAEQVAEIRRIHVRWSPEFGGKALAKRFGISTTQMSRIVKGDSWDWL